MDQSGKKLPFATTGGKPIAPDTNGAKPTDLVAKGKTDVAKGGEQLSPQPDGTNVFVSRRQPTTTPNTMPPATPMANRPQQAGSPAQRVNPQSIPQGGPVPPTPTAQPTTKAGPPFKNMK